jgi:uncharacterized membrane protein YphA (DoxX/SURF4 family)
VTTTAPSTTATRFDRWLYDNFDDVTDESLGVVRILYAGLLLLFMQPDFTWISSFPDAFYFPPIGPFLVFEGFPPGPFLTLLTVVLSISVVAILVGWRTGWTSAVATATMLVGYGFSYSFGKIDHTILMVLAPLLLGAGGWGRRWSLDERAGRARPSPAPRWPLVVLMVLLGWMFFTSGMQKAWEGWLDPTVQSSRGHHFNQLVQGDDALLSLPVARLDSALLYELMDVGTVLVECAVLFTIVSRRWFRNALALITLFHLGVLVVLNIAFWGNLVPYLAFFPVAVGPRARRMLDGLTGRLPSAGAALLLPLVGVAMALLVLAVGPPGTALIDALGFDGEVAVGRTMVLVGAGLGCWWLSREAMALAASAGFRAGGSRRPARV